MRVFEDLEDRKKALEKAFRNNDLKAFQLWPKYIAQKKLIDWSKTEKNGEKQLTQLCKKIQQQWEQTKIDTSNERKQAKK